MERPPSQSPTGDSIGTTPSLCSLANTVDGLQTGKGNTTEQSMATNTSLVPSSQLSMAVSNDFSNLSTVTSGPSGAASETPQASPVGGLSKDTLAELRAKGTLHQFKKGERTYYGVKEAELSRPISDFINSARKTSLLFRLRVLKVLMAATKKVPPGDASGWDTFVNNSKLQASTLKGIFGYLTWNTMWLILEAQGYFVNGGIRSSTAAAEVIGPPRPTEGRPRTRQDLQDILMAWDGNDSIWNNLWVRFQRFRELCDFDAHREDPPIGGASQTSKRTDSAVSNEGSRGKTNNKHNVQSDVSLVSRPASAQQSTVAVSTSSAGVSSSQQRKSERPNIWTPTKRMCHRGKTILKYLPLSVGIDRSHIPACKRFFCDKLVPYMILHRCTQKTKLNTILGFLARARRGQVRASTKMTKKLLNELGKQGEFIRLWGLEDRLPSPHDSVGRRLERDACLILGIKPEACVGTDKHSATAEG